MPQHAQKGKEQIRQRFGEVAENPIRLSKDVCRQVIDMLNADLGADYMLYFQYKKHHWVVEGPEFYQLHLFLDALAKGALEIGDQIAERLTYLGGVPLGSAAKMQETSFIKPEPEGVFDLRSMLQNDLTFTQEVIARFRQQIEQTMQLGDYGTAHCLREWLVEHEKWAHNLAMFLGDETLAVPQRQVAMGQ